MTCKHIIHKRVKDGVPLIKESIIFCALMFAKLDFFDLCVSLLVDIRLMVSCVCLCVTVKRWTVIMFMAVEKVCILFEFFWVSLDVNGKLIGILINQIFPFANRLSHINMFEKNECYFSLNAIWGSRGHASLNAYYVWIYSLNHVNVTYFTTLTH